MKTNVIEKLHKGKGCVLLLGGFDGLHTGHKKLVERAKTYRLPVGIMTILGGKSEQGIFTLAERKEIFFGAGVDFILPFEFEQIKDLSPNDFLSFLKNEFSPKAFVCGDDFRFGKDAAGTVETLKGAGQVCVEVVELFKMNGKKVSSREMKSFLQKGEVEKANELLEERFFLLGEVVKDRQIGRTICFPTANIAYPSDKCPLKKGVYETRVTYEKVTYKGITNYGARPTFDDKSVLTETYLDGFSGDLYGKQLKVEFVRFLREIEKFDSAQLLKAQLQKDIGRVRNSD